ncbi:GTP-binding protein [Aurantimonas sp. Leaf443]|uniref:CobW family GTP-binding protein n=1 Tax=Aurantimonas sp. Leaf443 TaxID=1736378 RepID=UPI0006FAA9DE|nr:GTP-binding protein [Aurantimonas sp. Leaf443]KQT88098.1 ATP-binding protein [Aurantimonas sp. Leaf443]
MSGAARGPIALTLLTGFLGAGKTTVLNRLLREPGLTDTAVVVNEFGAVGIDHLLVEAQAREGVVELSDGCLCCTVRGELVDTLLELAEAAGSRPLARVVVETTGLADPAPILAALMAHPALRDAYALDGVLTVVDALAGADNLDQRVEARRQVAVADRILLTKTDLASPQAARALRRAVAALNPAAALLEPGAAPLAPQILDCGLVDRRSRTADIARWMGEDTAKGCDACAEAGHDHHDHDHHPHAHGDVASMALVRDEPVEAGDIAAFLDLLGALHGARILRMKAIVHCREAPERPLALHGVRGYLHPPVRLPAWPAGSARRTRLVLIGEGLDERVVRDLFAAFTGGIAPDAPDRRALSDNPLAVPGYSFG